MAFMAMIDEVGETVMLRRYEWSGKTCVEQPGIDYSGRLEVLAAKTLADGRAAWLIYKPSGKCWAGRGQARVTVPPIYSLVEVRAQEGQRFEATVIDAGEGGRATTRDVKARLQAKYAELV